MTAAAAMVQSKFAPFPPPTGQGRGRAGSGALSLNSSLRGPG